MSQRKVLLGLLGANIMGSLSPAIFADAFAANGIDGYYHLMDTDRLPGRTLPKLLEAVKTAGFLGVNVTFPYKQEIIPLLDAIDPQAAQVGAINTVVIAPDGRTTGYNFDRAGWRNSFIETFGRKGADGATVVQIGAGGAGHAVSCALMDLGIATLVIHDLDKARAQSLCDDLAKHFGNRCRVATDLEKEIASADGVVNATQLGMRGFPGNPVPPSALKQSHWCADVIYTPIDTEFLKAASAKGARTLNGGGMCVHQAIEAFRQFTGVEPDLARLHLAFNTARIARDAAYAKGN